MGTLGTETGRHLMAYATGRLATRLEGLTQDEYLWSPAGDGDACWTIRPDDDDAGGVWRPDLGPGGRTRSDPDRPAPLTTIAWRIWHLGGCPAPAWPPVGFTTGPELVEAWFGQQPASEEATVATAEADLAVAQLLTRWGRFCDDVERLGDDDLLAPIGPLAKHHAEQAVVGLVLHVADELIHHGAEVALLRDLYRAGR